MRSEYQSRDTVRARSQTAPRFLPTRSPALPRAPAYDYSRGDLKPREKRVPATFSHWFPPLPVPKLFALANHQKSSLPNPPPPNLPKPARASSASLSGLVSPPEKDADKPDAIADRHYRSHAPLRKHACPDRGFRFRPPPSNQVVPRR